MRSVLMASGAVILACAIALIPACGKSSSGSGSGSASGGGSGGGEVFTSIENDALTFELKSGGTVRMVMRDIGESQGTYTVDGEKIIVSIDGQQHTFIRDGDCIAEPRQIFGKLCKGGKVGESSNVSTRELPSSGTWVAVNEDGELKLELKPGNKLTLSMTPKIGKPSTHDGKYVIEEGTCYATIEPGDSMVLKYVNNVFESNAFGLPMKFVKQ